MKAVFFFWFGGGEESYGNAGGLIYILPSPRTSSTIAFRSLSIDSVAFLADIERKESCFFLVDADFSSLVLLVPQYPVVLPSPTMLLLSSRAKIVNPCQTCFFRGKQGFIFRTIVADRPSELLFSHLQQNGKERNLFQLMASFFFTSSHPQKSKLV